MDVPDMDAYAVSLVIPADRTLLPGAETSGLMAPDPDGPRLEKEAIVVPDRAPTPMTPMLESAGELTVLQLGPLFPLARTGMIPAVFQALMIVLNQVCPLPPPHELLTTCGARLQLALPPL